MSALHGVLRTLHLVYEDPAVFREQYARNLSQGGGFVPTRETFELRELVEVCLVAAFAGEELRLRAEVVHHQPHGGVSVQFLAPVAVVRSLLARIVERAREVMPGPPPLFLAPGEEHADPEPDDALRSAWTDDEPLRTEDPNERTHVGRAPRHPLRVAVRVTRPDGACLEGHTRNVSASGLLLSVPGEGIPLGSELGAALLPRSGGGPVETSVRVMRQMAAPGLVAALGVQLRLGAGEAELVPLLEEHVRARAGRAQLSDRFAAGGAADALRLVAGFVESGTVAFDSGAEEALLVLESGRLRAAGLGPVTGLKALARVLAWPGGSYELCDDLFLPVSPDLPLPVGEAIERALELAVPPQDAPALPQDACFVVHRNRLAIRRQPLSAAETSLLLVAGRGQTLRRILDAAPESDGALLRALASLLDEGILSLR